MLQVLLFDNIPTSEFLGLEKNIAYSKTGETFLEIAESNSCKFTVPSIIYPHIQPIFYTNDKMDKVASNVILVEQNMPLALSHESTGNKEMDIHSMASVLGLMPYYCKYIDIAKVVQTYESNTGNVIDRHVIPTRPW